MADFIFLMHEDGGGAGLDWEPYLSKLREAGVFQGSSAIGRGGECCRKAGSAPDPTFHIGGFIRVTADNLDHAKTLLKGNPVYESGGTVEIRDLPNG